MQPGEAGGEVHLLRRGMAATRKLSPGLTFEDLRVAQANLEGVAAATARNRF